MSDQNQQDPAATEQVEQAPQTEGDRMANALQLFADEKVDEANETVTVPEEQAQKELEQQPGEDRSEYYARLVDKDREIRQLRSQLKGDQPDLRGIAQEDPMRALQELGLTPEQIFEQWAGVDDGVEMDDEGEPIQQQEMDPAYRQELEVLKQELQQMKDERAQNATQSQIQNELYNINEMVSSEEGKWDIIKSTRDEGSLNLVLETAAEMYKLNQEIPDYVDVLDAVEEHLTEYYGAQYEKLSQLQKLQHKHGLSDKVEPKKELKQEMEKSPLPGPTLSATTTGDTPVPRSLGEQERYQRALDMLNESGD